MRRVVMIICVALLFIPIVIQSRKNQERPGLAALYVAPAGTVRVKIGGDVQHQGVYVVSANAMADSVIKLANPSRPLKWSGRGPAAIPLRDGAALTVTGQHDGLSVVTVDRMTVSECLIMKIPLDIALMSEADFDRLPGVGPALARRIIEYRQNNGGILRVSDLLLVEGIGEKKYETLCQFFQHAKNIK